MVKQYHNCQVIDRISSILWNPWKWIKVSFQVSE